MAESNCLYLNPKFVENVHPHELHFINYIRSDLFFLVSRFIGGLGVFAEPHRVVEFDSCGTTFQKL